MDELVNRVKQLSSKVKELKVIDNKQKNEDKKDSKE